MTPAPRIALIHALRLSVEPINQSFDRLWPEAVRINLLDDSLSTDRERDGAVTHAMIDRFVDLGRYAEKHCGADAILFTCSAFGEAIDAVTDCISIPVRKPTSAMVSASTESGGRIGLLATFAPTLQSLVPEFPSDADLAPRLIEGALAAATDGNPDLHDRLAAEAAAEMTDCDCFALSQFSLARAQPLVAQMTQKPVFTTPDCAVEELRAHFA